MARQDPASKHPSIAIGTNYSMDFLLYRLKLAKQLQAKGYRVIAILPKDPDYNPIIREAGIPILELDIKRRSLSLSKTYKNTCTLIRELQRQQISTIHAFRLEVILPATLAKLWLGKRVFLINQITGLGALFTKSTLKGKLFQKILLSIFSFCYLFSDRMVVQNPDDLKSIKWLPFINYDRLTMILGSGVDTKKFNPDVFSLADKISIRSSMGIGTDEMIVTFISRLIPEKGLETLRNTVSKCRKIPSGSSIKFLIVGWVDDENQYSPAASLVKELDDFSNTLLLGKRSDIAELLAISDIYLYPSYYREGVPRTVLEAMASALPVITTNTAGCNITVQDGISGFVLSPDDANGFAEKIAVLYDNPHLRQAMGSAARRRCTETFDDSIVFNQFETIYNSAHHDDLQTFNKTSI